MQVDNHFYPDGSPDGYTDRIFAITVSKKAIENYEIGECKCFLKYPSNPSDVDSEKVVLDQAEVTEIEKKSIVCNFSDVSITLNMLHFNKITTITSKEEFKVYFK